MKYLMHIHIQSFLPILLSIISVFVALHSHVSLTQLKNEFIHDEDHRSTTMRSLSTSGVVSRKRKRRRNAILLSVKVLDAAGDGVQDDTFAIQRAIDKAAENKRRGTIHLDRGVYLITKPLILHGGVKLQGQGYGSSPLALSFDAGGTVIAYCGDDFAIKVSGHAASIENLAIYDWKYPEGSTCQSLQAQGAIKIGANATLIESVTMKNILLYWFMGGTALLMEARNNGGIAYTSIENMRIRHAKEGIRMTALDEFSFVNSNSFHDGAISGAISDVAITASGPGACNGNIVNGMVIEPPVTGVTHVHVKGPKTNIRMNNVRLEGSQMPENRPLVIVEDESYGNVMNGILGHTFVRADFNRNPEITFLSNKMVGLNPPVNNLFWNAAFHGLQESTGNIPGWNTPGSNFELSRLSTVPPLYPDHNIIQISYRNFGGPFKLSPKDLPSSPIHSFCTFGIYAQTETPNSIVAAMKFESGSIISSTSHSGSGQWEFIGLSSLFDKVNGPLPYFSITGDVNITAPTFMYGQGRASPGLEYMSSSGAKMAGLFISNMVTVNPPEDSDRLVLLKEGNVFDIQAFPDSGGGSCITSYKYMNRINDVYADRFPIGSIITLLFPSCGGCVPCLALNHGPYLNLKAGSAFSPGATNINFSITLVSKGDGTWREISRTN